MRGRPDGHPDRDDRPDRDTPREQAKKDVLWLFSHDDKKSLLFFGRDDVIEQLPIAIIVRQYCIISESHSHQQQQVSRIVCMY